MILLCCIHVTVSSLLRLRLLRFRWFSCGGSAVAIVLSLLKMALHIVHRLLEVLHVSEGHALGAVAQTFHGIIIHCHADGELQRDGIHLALDQHGA